MPHPPLLIESWLPIEAIGAESKRERGASSALPPLYFLHVWWALRPLIPSGAAVFLVGDCEFGSVARGEARPDSVIDFLVNLEAGRSLLDLARLLRELQALLNCPVDVVTEAGLRSRLRPRVLEEARPL